MSARASPPFAGMTKISLGGFFRSLPFGIPWRSETNASQRPSGDHRGAASSRGPKVKRAAAEVPSNGTIQTADRYSSLSRSMVRSTNATRSPSGEICGSDANWNEYRSSAVSGGSGSIKEVRECHR